MGEWPQVSQGGRGLGSGWPARKDAGAPAVAVGGVSDDDPGPWWSSSCVSSRIERTPVADPLPTRFLDALRDRGVEPLEVGQVVVGTRAAHRSVVQDLIWEFGLEVQVIGNRNEVMMRPAGVNKATGLDHALRELSLVPSRGGGRG